MGCFGDLPEGLITNILSMTSPRDSCRSSVISRGFKSAADSDAVWIKFLPSDFEEIISRSVTPVQFPTKKELYFALCNAPILLDGGYLSFALDKESGKKCYMLAALELSIGRGDIEEEWQYSCLDQSRFGVAAELQAVYCLDIRGRMETAKLSPNTTYSAYFVFNLAEENYGFGSDLYPVKASVRFVWGWEDMNTEEDEAEYYNNCTSVYLNVRTSRRVRRPDGRLPRERDDGWLEIELGEFSTAEGDEVEMRLMETKLNVKWGLLVEGIEVRPKVIN